MLIFLFKGSNLYIRAQIKGGKTRHMEDIYRKEIEKLKPTYKPRWRRVLRAFFKYIFTRKIRIWVGFYVLLVLVFYFLVKKNLAISMFFAFVVWGAILYWFLKDHTDDDDDWFHWWLNFYSPYSPITWRRKDERQNKHF